MLRAEGGDRRKENGGFRRVKTASNGEEEEEACSTELLGVILTGEAIVR